MNVFQRKGVTYAAAYRPPCGLYPNRNEGVILRKTDERVRVFELAGWKSAERIVWMDVDNTRYVRWDGRFRRIEPWHSFKDDWRIDHSHTALRDA